MTTLTASRLAGEDGLLTLTIKDPTGTRSTQLRVPPSMPAGEVARLSGTQLNPGLEALYELRDDRSSDYFDDDAPIGTVLPEDPELTTIGKAHLG